MTEHEKKVRYVLEDVDKVLKEKADSIPLAVDMTGKLLASLLVIVDLLQKQISELAQQVRYLEQGPTVYGPPSMSDEEVHRTVQQMMSLWPKEGGKP